MSAEAAKILILKQDRESGSYRYNYDHKADQDDNRQSTLFWDEIAKKWPKERFSSFFTFDQNA